MRASGVVFERRQADEGVMKPNLEFAAIDTQLLDGGSSSVDVDAIERELDRLWKAAAEAHETERPHDAVMRACSANLIVITSAPDSGGASTFPDAAEVAAEVVTRHPCRVLVVDVLAQSLDPPLQASISARCQMPEQGKRICCEQIHLQADASAEEDLPGVILPLLIPGLPVYLWWIGDGAFEIVRYHQLIESVDCFLFDSALSDDPRVQTARLLEAIPRRRESLSFRDLNWARLTPWRQMVAQFFDARDALAYLPLLESVDIEVVPSRPRRFHQAALLAGWIMGQLNLEPESVVDTKRGVMIETRGERSVQFEIGVRPGPPRNALDHWAHREGEAPAEPLSVGVLSVSLSTRGDGRGASFSVCGGDDEESALTREKTLESDMVERRVRHRHRTVARLVGDELAFAGRDLVFEKALAKAADIYAGSCRAASIASVPVQQLQNELIRSPTHRGRDGMV